MGNANLLHFLLFLTTFPSASPLLPLTRDATLLLSFKSTIISDPLSSLSSWNSSNLSPCSWFGITCSSSTTSLNSSSPDFRVTSIDLPSSLLLGTISTDLGFIHHLTFLNLSNNSLTGSLPYSLFSSQNLQILDLSNNFFSGELPPLQKSLSLISLNLSYNTIAGDLPTNLSILPALKTISLRGNNFSGNIKGSFGNIQSIDFSCNMITGHLPESFHGENLYYYNVSFNAISGTIPTTFSGGVPANAILDISHNNLSGEIPTAELYNNQKSLSFLGNLDLCGKPMNKPCPVIMPSELEESGRRRRRFTTGEISVIVCADLMAICFIALCSAYTMWRMKKPVLKSDGGWWWCRKGKRRVCGGEGKVVTVCGEEELEMEKLLRASVNFMGRNGSTITYKAVMEDGGVVVVRRMGEGVGGEDLEEFESNVRMLAKVGQHKNLNKVIGFYWSHVERLLVSEYVPGGSLAGIRYKKKGGSSPCPLQWEIRLKIALGVANGLHRLHEKKHVHGNLKPANILLSPEMEPKLADFGLYRMSTSFDMSVRVLDRKGSTTSRDSIPEFKKVPSMNTSTTGSGCVYQPPEALRCSKRDSKWDVYSFGVVLLELVTGKTKIIEEVEGPENVVVGLWMVDATIRSDGNDDTLLASLRLGLACVSSSPQKRPSMKEVIPILEKIKASSSSKHVLV